MSKRRIRRRKNIEMLAAIGRARMAIDGCRALDPAQAFSFEELAAFGRTFDGGTVEDVRDRALCGLILYESCSWGQEGTLDIPPVLRWAIDKWLEAGGHDDSTDAPLFVSLETGRPLTEGDINGIFRRRCERAGIRIGGRDMDTFVETGQALLAEAVEEVPEREMSVAEAMGLAEAAWKRRLDEAVKVLFGLVDVEDAEKEGGA